MRFHCLCLMAGASPFLFAATPSQRTVADTELGAMVADPNGYEWADLGAYYGAPQSSRFGLLNTEALRIALARFHVFKPSDADTFSWFPYTEFRDFEAREIAAGKAPLFVTATYAGRKRPVVLSWSLGLQSGVATTPASEWHYLVNTGDDRFIRFWINRYIRGIIWKNRTSMNKLWVALDECAFTPTIYGVVDDTNHFVPLSAWDPPFPQNETEFLGMIKRFFARVKALAPDISLMPNVGSLAWSEFPAVYQDVGGIAVEDVYLPDPITAYTRNKLYNQVTAYTWASAQGKVMLFRANPPENDTNKILANYMMYALLKGLNSFYAPRIKNTYTALPPSTYTGLAARLGNPVGPLSSIQAPRTTNAGYRLYWRSMEGGIVYVNWTGATQNVPLPSGTPFYDLNGNVVTQLTIGDTLGACAFYGKGPRAQRPAFSPRLDGAATTPLIVAMSSETPGAVVRYTFDGSNPTYTSPVASGPITLSATARIKAKTFPLSGLGSFNTSITYSLISAAPTVQFALDSDSGRAMLYYPVLALSSTSPLPVTVPYTIFPPAGSRITGTLTIQPGQKYAYFPVNISATGSTTVTLSGPQGAVLGSPSTFRYTVQ